ncbi:MAG TPA: outer membrane beta-barrel protein [Planctomycetota bacterium]|nr:outer membrane beta-barrel protein [Planctomycetota bacterium]
MALAIALPGTTLAQDGESDPNPDPLGSLEEPHDPFGLGFEKLAYSVGLKLVEVFDDNVFLAPAGEESDRITVAILKARLRYGTGAGSAVANYRGRYRRFREHDEFDGMEHFFDARGVFSVAPLRFEAGVDANALKDPFDVLQVVGRVDSRFDRGFVKAIADFNRVDVEVEGARARFTLDDDGLDRGNYTRLEAGLLAAVDAWDEASAFIEFRLHETEYDEPDFGDLSLLRLVAGVRGSLTAKLRGEARVGIARAELEEGTVFPADDFTGPTAIVALTWVPGEKHEIRADVHREPIESVVTGLAIVDGVRVSYRFLASPRWTVQGMVSWDRERESDGSNERHAFHVRGGVQWAVAEKIYADAGALFRSADSDDAALEYENLRLSIGLGVEW